MTTLHNGAPRRARFFARLELRLNAALDAIESINDPAPGAVDLREVALALAAAAATMRALRSDCLNRPWRQLQV